MFMVPRFTLLSYIKEEKALEINTQQRMVRMNGIGKKNNNNDNDEYQKPLKNLSGK